MNSGSSGEFGFSGWKEQGAVLGVALDLVKGSMLVRRVDHSEAVNAQEEGRASEVEGVALLTAITSGVAPSPEKGAGLYPAVSVWGKGVKVGYNFGGDENRHPPPSGEFLPIAMSRAVNDQVR